MVDYNGTLNVTMHGKTCQAWTSQFPHQHEHCTEEQNFCRAVDGKAFPWCFTTDPDVRWQYCDVPICDISMALYYIVTNPL